MHRRHRSAHSANYSPTATDIAGLRADLLCVAMCFDVSISSSMEQSLSSAEDWANGNCDWRAGVNLYTAKPCAGGLRLMRFGRKRALHVVRDLSERRAEFRAQLQVTLLSWSSMIFPAAQLVGILCELWCSLLPPTPLHHPVRPPAAARFYRKNSLLSDGGLHWAGSLSAPRNSECRVPGST